MGNAIAASKNYSLARFSVTVSLVLTSFFFVLHLEFSAPIHVYVCRPCFRQYGATIICTVGSLSFIRLCPARCTYHQTSIRILDEMKCFASTAEQNGTLHTTWNSNESYSWVKEKNRRQMEMLVAAIVCTIYWNNVNRKRNLKFLLGNVCIVQCVCSMDDVFDI